MGVGLVAEWILAQDRIAVQLTRAYDDLAQAYTEGLAGLGSDAAVDLAQVEILRDRLLRGRLGTYLDYPEQNLALALQGAEEAAASRLPLLVIAETWGDGQIFRLSEDFP
jgi:hypothetical protein